MEAAVRDIVEDGVGLQKAALTYEIDKMTLLRYLAKPHLRNVALWLVCNGINANRNYIAPFLILPRVRAKEYIYNGATPGTMDIGHPKHSDWMKKKNFMQFLDHLVISETYISLDITDYAKKSGVILLTFPPHTSHSLYPLDVAVYSSLQGVRTPMKIHNIGEIVGAAPLSFTPRNIISGFKVTGIHPFNRDIFTDEDFLPASTTDRPNPEVSKENPSDQQTTASKGVKFKFRAWKIK
ncbi:hypothetical protein PR048_010788 [Dryococelus australis]|uniref:DDE-1 domain-containing protein n=1 Tax=Dryococelus australis TaxID=614101 RepID=A0ABQ9I3P0_9NEOP|nr:hypothetical protein PR048_010788 [Dryococelus australis]